MLNSTPHPNSLDPLTCEFSRTKPSGHYQISLSTGVLGYETKADGSIHGEFYPLAAGGKSFLIEATAGGDITSLKVAQRWQHHEGTRSLFHQSLSIAPLSPHSDEWQSALERIQAGFELYGR